MNHINLFNSSSEYELYKNSSDYILPNISYIEEIKSVKYEPKKPKKTYILRATYNATPDNLVAFTGATNVTSLNVNGTPIKVEPIKNEITTFDVLGENISMNLETSEATFPESYLIKSPVSSWSFKAKDPNYVINENTYICMLAMMDGMTMAQPIPFEEAMGYVFTTNDGVTLEAVDEFLADMNMQIQSGMQIGFTLVDIDENNNTFIFIDTEHQTNVITGGLPTYSFDSEGLYDVEIELADPVISMLFAETPLVSIEIGDGITSIGKSAFQSCSGLTSITIPDSVTSIGDYTFNGCSSLTSITIPDSVTSIGGSTFYQCTGLTSIVIPNSVTSIGDTAFYQCTGLTSIVIPDSVTSIGYSAFCTCSGLTGELVIPDSVETIEGNAFNSCKGLTSVTIGSGVTSIEGYAFGHCSGLTAITSYAVTAPTIDSYTFRNVKGGGTLYVPIGSDYSSWMSTSSYYLGKYNWTIEYI